MINGDFFDNLIKSCERDRLIREDGKRLSLFNRVSDFFHHTCSEDHFATACAKLANACTDGSIGKLNVGQQIYVLTCFKEIQKTLKDPSARKQCEKYIDSYEETILSKDRVYVFSELIFANLIEAFESRDKKRIQHQVRELCTLIDYASADKDLIGQIIRMWRDFTESRQQLISEKSKHLFDEANETIVNKLFSLNINNNLNTHLMNYLDVIFSHLKSTFKNLNRKQVSSCFELLKKLMDQQADNKEFIKKGLEGIDHFLKESVFPTSSYVSELKKSDLLILKDLFPIIHQHISALDDPKLALSLKIKCANLPCPSERSTYPHLFLREQEQLDALLMSLVAKENKFIEDFINEYLKTNRVPSQHLSILIELVEDSSDLSDENRTKLREALASQLANNALDWNNPEHLTEALTPLLVNNPKQPIVLQIQRICLTKQFFLKQVGLPADMVVIPRWYHATRAVEAILTSSQIEVRHEKLYEGAWISTKREPDFGPYVLSLSQRIEQIDPRVRIHFEHSHSRWRGIGHTIDLKTTEGNSQLALVGIPESVIGTAKKIQQNSLVRILQQQGFPNVAVLPVEQVDFMQKEVSETLGCPNLSDQWWGLGRAYSKHQQHLHETIKALNLDPNLFRLDEDPTNNQAKIGMVQNRVTLSRRK